MSRSQQKRATAKSAETAAKCIIGFDSEYVPGPKENRLVSYQTFGVCNGVEWPVFFGQRGQRLALDEIIGETLERGKAAGAFDHYPKQVCLAAHWSVADLTMVADFCDLKARVDSLRKTLATVGRPVCLRWSDANRHLRKVTARVVDTMLLAPQGKKLDDLGKLLGLEKIRIPDGAIENMEKFLDEQPELFRAYALRDAEIAAKYALRMGNFMEQFVGESGMPVTLGGLAKDFAIAKWKKRQAPWEAALGWQTVKARVHTRKGYRTRDERVPVPGYKENFGLPNLAYHGGRNECFYFGASPEDDFRDYDFCGAYPTILAMIKRPRYDAIVHTTKMEDFQPGTMGFARVHFEFPASARFPCLAVRSDHGLVFPRRGTAYATAQELHAAASLGARLDIVEGMVVPTAPERIFGETIAELTRLRAGHAADPLQNALFKEMANSLYGKLGQGLREKMVFDARCGRSVPMPDSSLTNPYYAAHVTGFARAMLAEVINALPQERMVISATTDGFLTNATEEDVKDASTGPLAKLFAESRREIAGNANVTEAKHRVQQVLAWRTRGVVTLQGFEGGKVVLAKAGLKTPGRLGRDGQNEWVTRQFLDREIDTKYEHDVFASIREIWHGEQDLTRRAIEKRVRMDFDWKRKPREVSTIPVQGVPLLAFATQPWDCVEEFIQCRQQWEDFSRQSKRCLKTEEDLAAFNDYLRSAPASGAGLRRPIEGGSLRLALRQICRAFVSSSWGLNIRGKTNWQFVQFMLAGGFTITEDDLKNAFRLKKKVGCGLSPQSVPATPEVERLVRYLWTDYPDFRPAMLLRPESEAAGLGLDLRRSVAGEKTAQNGHSAQFSKNQELAEAIE
jgi:hypothetical protein